MLHVTINGESCEFPSGITILDAIRARGIHVPTLCHDPRLKPYGGCRLCVVAVAGATRPVTSCNTPIADRMAIQTHTPEIEDLRRTLLALLTRSYPTDSAANFPDKEFHKILNRYGIASGGGAVCEGLEDQSHPYIAVDMSRCITCFKCVRICNELQGQFVWQVLNRGDATKIVPDSGTTLVESSCVSCGACVDVCPSGALEDKTVLESGFPEAWTKTTCPYCGVGCEMWVGTRDDKIVEVKPVLESPVSKGHLCVKGRYAVDFVDAPDRITDPMIRKNGEWKKAAWDEAIDYAVSELKRIIARDGPDATGVLGSARATNEENYLTQKFARVVLGTNNVDCCARVCHGPSAAALKTMLGTGAATNSFDDIEVARTILVAGSNATENHPIVGARIKQHAIRGANLIVIDPRKTELARYANIHLAPRPGTNIPLLNAMAHVIVAEKLYDAAFLRDRVSEQDDYFTFIRDWTPEKASAICGVDAEDIRRAARLYAVETPSMCFHGLGMTEHVQGTEGVMDLVNLALLTGNLGKPGTGINPLRGQNNVQGSAHMGCDPSILTGSVAIQDGRPLFETVWRTSIPATKGLNLMEMLDAAADGKFKALWVVGYDVFLSNANAAATRRAFEAMELVVIQDFFMNETAREFGTVFFPCVSSFEKDGTFMNAERRIQRVRKAIEPRGESKTDSEILWAAAKGFGIEEGFSFGSAEEIWNEIRAVWPQGRGITYKGIDTAGIQWPCPEDAHPGTTVLHGSSFTIGQKAALKRISYEPTRETTDADFPFMLNTGRSLYQFNVGTMTMRTPNVVLRPFDFLDISPDDAQSIGVCDGDRVRVASRYGEAVLPIRVDSGMKTGELFTTFHTVASFLNNVTSPYRDGVVKSPEYKVTAVRVERI